ncbi:hypothetical protein E2493_18440, partial [Sphingomonas parva]
AHNDVYKFSRGFGQDVISEAGWSNESWNDAIEFDATVAASDVTIEQSSDGNHLILKIAGSEDRITMEWAVTDANYRIDQVRFADGTVWSFADLIARAQAPTAADEMFNGTNFSETTQGGAGN